MNKLDAQFFQPFIKMERIVNLEDPEFCERQPHVYGALHQRPRLVAALERCLNRGDGDVIEIGCLNGGTSELLAEVCQRYGRTLVCVDPWADIPGCKWAKFSTSYPVFLKAVAPYKDCVRVIRMASQDPKAIMAIQEHEYAFAFVDGWHEKDYVVTDLHTVLPITKYAVASDDHRYDMGVQAAHKKIRPEFPDWEFLEFADFREAWFTK